MPFPSPEPLPCVELETGAKSACAVIWMHGLGADGNDFVPIVNRLALPRGMSIRFVFPHAPMRPVSINRGLVMRAWHDYDVGESGSGIRVEPGSLGESQQAVEALIGRERQRGIEPGKIVLAGFSQGGALALHVGLHYPEPLAGILALSCYLPVAPLASTRVSRPDDAGVPIFMAHGTLDNVVPLTAGRAARQGLLESGRAVEWHEYPMAHSVCEDEISDIGSWLVRVLA